MIFSSDIKIMTTIKKNIFDKFIIKLSESETVDSEKITQLQDLFSGDKKPKTEDFVKIFTLPVGDDLQ